MTPAQLPLGLDGGRRASFASFWAGPNETAVAALRRAAASPGEPWVSLSGPGGVGKSHLLIATARACPGAVVLPGRGVDERLGPEELVEFAAAPLVCIDDVDALFGDEAWERALFGLLVRLHQNGVGFVFASGDGPRAARPSLPDLASRLTWGEAYRLLPLDDADKEGLLRARAGEIGLALDERTIAYMLTRLPRGTGDLLAWLERIAAASLAAQRRPSVPLVRSLLDEARRERGDQDPQAADADRPRGGKGQPQTTV